MASTSVHALMNKSLTASEDGTSLSINPQAKNFLGFLKATNVNAATTLDVVIEHSPNKTDWFEAAAFTQLVGTNGSEVKTLSDSLFVNVRASATLAGATQEADVLVQLWYDPTKG